VEVPGPLGELIPGRGLRRGAVVTVAGPLGAGASSVAFGLAAAVTAIGEWAAVAGLDASLGALAAAEAGVALDRFAVVRRVPPDRWAAAVAVLLDGVSLVIAEVPRSVRAADARRLIARAREREVILVPIERAAPWPAEATLRLLAAGGHWADLDEGGVLLTERTVRVTVDGRGAAGRSTVLGSVGGAMGPTGRFARAG
jgi:hypothetical protein